MCAELLLRALPHDRERVISSSACASGDRRAKLSCRADIHGLLREVLVPLLTEGWFEALASELHVYYANA